MARMSVQQRERAPQSLTARSYTQTVSIIVGFVMVILGLSGIQFPGFMGMHISVMHSAVLVGGGAFSIWSGLIDDSHKAYLLNLGLGVFFAINAIAGFFLGKPGVPEVGYTARDRLLVEVAPGFIELGLVDHLVHSVLAIIFFTGAFSWKRHHRRRYSNPHVRR